MSILEEALKIKKEKVITESVEKAEKLFKQGCLKRQSKDLYERVIIPFAQKFLEKDFDVKYFNDINMIECHNQKHGIMFVLQSVENHINTFNSVEHSAIRLYKRDFKSKQFYFSCHQSFTNNLSDNQNFFNLSEGIKKAIANILAANYFNEKEN